MKKLKTSSVILLLGFTIYLCFTNYKLRSQLRNQEASIIGKTDTIYTKKDFLPIQYDNLLNPRRIFFYGVQNNEKKDVEVLTQSEPQEKDSLVNLTLDRDNLTLSFLNQGNKLYSSKMFNLDLSNYKYSWYNGKLTTSRVKNKIHITPYVYGSYRPFNNLWDMGLGISFKTKRFNYKLGINGFHYPNYFSGIKADLELKITYNF